MNGAATVAAALSLLGGAVEPAQKEFCSRLDGFERDVIRSRASSASIKMMWDWGEFSVYCAHQTASPGSKLCKWLPLHTSREFPHILISQVFRCYAPGDRPSSPDTVETMDRTFHTKAGNRLRLEAGNLRTGPDLPWARLTVEKAK